MTVTVLFFLVLIIVFLLMIYFIQDDSVDEETIVTTTTTTTTTDQVYQHPPLVRQWEGAQPFVIDPADGIKFYVNTTDDMYEDANGFIWNLN